MTPAGMSALACRSIPQPLEVEMRRVTEGAAITSVMRIQSACHRLAAAARKMAWRTASTLRNRDSVPGPWPRTNPPDLEKVSERVAFTPTTPGTPTPPPPEGPVSREQAA
jgi:hypothetical protein